MKNNNNDEVADQIPSFICRYSRGFPTPHPPQERIGLVPPEPRFRGRGKNWPKSSAPSVLNCCQSSKVWTWSPRGLKPCEELPITCKTTRRTVFTLIFTFLRKVGKLMFTLMLTSYIVFSAFLKLVICMRFNRDMKSLTSFIILS